MDNNSNLYTDNTPVEVNKDDHMNNVDTSILQSSADNVDSHLKSLENNAFVAQRSLSIEEQLFTKEELAGLVNLNKLEALMNDGDNLVSYLTCEINKFEE